MIRALASLISDASVGAGIAGLFSIANTLLNCWLLRRQRHMRRELGHGVSASAAAAEAAMEACRVAKAIGASIRHEDPLLVVRERLQPVEPPEDG
jgi:hypothetical protein